MKKNGKVASTLVTQRDLFNELAEGLTALADARHGKRTLNTHQTECGSCTAKQSSET